MKPTKLTRGNDLTIIQYIVEIIVVAAIYIITARLGQLFAIPPGNITPVWIPSGVMLAWALIRGNYIWPGIFLGAFIGNVWAYADFSSAYLIFKSLSAGAANGIGDVLCTIGAAYFFTLGTGDGNPFKSLKAFLWLFIFGVLLGPFVSATMGVNALFLAGFLPSESYLISYFTWFIGDAVGVLLFTPLILVCVLPHSKRSYCLNWSEYSIFIILLIQTPFLSFYPEIFNMIKHHPAIFIVPLFLWCALRMNHVVIFYSAAYLSITSIILSYFGLSLFSAQTQFQSVLTLQFFIIVTISSIFILSSLITEKENALTQLKKNYDRDSLTKIFNRQYFEKLLGEEIERQARYKTPFCVIMYDIDFFKVVNDTYGHPFGDKVLIQLSTLVAAEIRDIDTLARWGGEEFMILMPQTQIEGAKIIAERIRKRVENASFLPQEVLTISMGLIEFSPKNNQEYHIKQLDNALYAAKKNGRNQLKCIKIQESN